MLGLYLELCWGLYRDNIGNSFGIILGLYRESNGIILG